MIMTCPKCKGSGKTWIDYGKDSSAAPQETICNSCGGLGYVTDNNRDMPIIVKAYNTTADATPITQVILYPLFVNEELRS